MLNSYELFMFTVVRIFYSFCFLIMLPLVFLRLLWRSRLAPGYRQRWLERLGILRGANLLYGACHRSNSEDKAHSIWVHAVSLGETIAATPVIKALQQQYPQYLIVVTTTTPTGSAQVRKTFVDSVLHTYLPYDLPWCLSAFFNKINPKVCVILETELWPNLLQQCWQRKVPVTIINARLSPQSVKRYGLVKWYLRGGMFPKVNIIAAQSVADKAKFVALGMPEAKVIVAGNIKFDLKIVPEQQHLGKQLRASWGERPVWIAASTHEGEEAIVLAAFKQIQQEFADAILILVPRHPERFGKVAELLQTAGYKFVKRTETKEQQSVILSTEQVQQDATALAAQVEQQTASYVASSAGAMATTMATAEVLLGDTIGELGIFYQAADAAFVGGSLVPIGGHNVLEAAVAAIPIATGKHMHNFVEIKDKLLAAQALRLVANADELADTVKIWFRNKEQAATIGARAKAVVVENSGATQKVVDIINGFL